MTDSPAVSTPDQTKPKRRRRWLVVCPDGQVHTNLSTRASAEEQALWLDSVAWVRGYIECRGHQVVQASRG